MPAKPFSRNELLSINKRFLQKTSDGTTVKAAPARDRIKWWNVVPGDQVRVMGDKKMPMREVLAVNKVSNRVFLQSDKKYSLGGRSTTTT